MFLRTRCLRIPVDPITSVQSHLIALCHNVEVLIYFNYLSILDRGERGYASISAEEEATILQLEEDAEFLEEQAYSTLPPSAEDIAATIVLPSYVTDAILAAANKMSMMDEEMDELEQGAEITTSLFPIKQFLYFVYFIGLFKTANVSLPENFISFAGFFDFYSYLFASSSVFSCALGSGTQVFIGPILLTSSWLLFLNIIIPIILVRIHSILYPSGSESLVLRVKIINSILVTQPFFLFTTLRLLSNYLECDSIDSGYYLSMDPEIQCFVGTHLFNMIMAIVLIGLWFVTVIIQCVFVILLKSSLSKLQYRSLFGHLTDSFHDDWLLFGFF